MMYVTVIKDGRSGNLDGSWRCFVPSSVPQLKFKPISTKRREKTMSGRSGEVILSQETQHFAEVIVNGRSLGKKQINGTPTVKELALQLAQEHGIRTFTVTVNDQVVTSESANQPYQPGSRFGIQAKDSRGSKKRGKKKATAVNEPPPSGETMQAEAGPTASEPAYEDITNNGEAVAEPSSDAPSTEQTN